MTNNQIIFSEAQKLAEAGIISYTGRVFQAKTADGQTIEVKETEAIQNAKEAYEAAMKEVQELIKTDGANLRDKIAYMRHLGDVYRTLISANYHL